MVSADRVVLSRQEYEDLLETIEALSSSEFLQSLKEAREAYLAGKTRPLDEFLAELDAED